ncbi:hypothetical protein A2982_04090 [candidate division WWE3 bacterium RIFCSPLOWO2_01_FULL_39_13]|uniref:HicB-like antitoxin of toxin-antitoxin system domain-containing protein n=1 Tax=candidate division WWE3 bacterium RIFCSPLOWO2_01_FULL_39_13 TaxID=1802624 RepID=A0A1F4V2E8_UNCKA|nr:MAG: hypothetical protein A2982_04090 [candidate division WWE3 bacterium RIFCSPLOWO2_01_FULL_39_13]
MVGKQRKVTVSLRLPVSFRKEGCVFVAYSPDLDISTHANTFELAEKRFKELVVIFFEELVENNSIDETLHELNWRKIDKKWQPPVVVATESLKLEVPVCV